MASSPSDTINQERPETDDNMAVAELAVVHAKPPPTPPRQAIKRGSSALHLLRAVLFMAKRSRSKNNKIPTNAEVVEAVRKTGLWRRLLSGMRPLHPHAQLVQSSPPRPALPPPSPSPDRSFHDVQLPPPSPAASYCSTSSSSPSPDGMTSRYASVGDLLALDNVDDGEDDIDGYGTPNLIDVQAEEFIARFYEQIRLQRAESVALRGREDRWSFNDVDV